MKTIFVTLFLCLFSIASTGKEGWVTKDGKPAPNTESRKSMDGFAGWLIVTDDADWKEKWNTPPIVTPQFSEPKTIFYDDKLTVLVFYSNPKVNSSDEINILCDIKVTRPDGSVSFSSKDFLCASGKIQGRLTNVYLSNAIIDYIGEKKDPLGKWLIDVTLKDTVRGIEIPLRNHFNLAGAKSNLEK